MWLMTGEKTRWRRESDCCRKDIGAHGRQGKGDNTGTREGWHPLTGCQGMRVACTSQGALLDGILFQAGSGSGLHHGGTQDLSSIKINNGHYFLKW